MIILNLVRLIENDLNQWLIQKQNYNHNLDMQTKIALTLLALTASLLFITYDPATEEDQLFQSFRLQFNKNYLRNGEEQYRKMIFLKNKEKIDQHNSDPTQTYIKGVNHFTDLTLAQLDAMYADFKLPNKPKSIQLPEPIMKTGVDIDWAEAGKVGPVIDQGQCGASWAFSAIGAFESAHMIKNNNILGSAQELLDCTNSYGNYGCNGGFMASSFEYIKQHRIHESKDYPYTARSDKCKTPLPGTTWTLSSYTEMTKCDELLNALSFGPVSVAVDMSSLYNYKSGIVTKCGSTPSSGSLVVGVTDTYWRLKQSFSVNWGQSGYFRLARGNTCAVCNIASYPTL